MKRIGNIFHYINSDFVASTDLGRRLRDGKVASTDLGRRLRKGKMASTDLGRRLRKGKVASTDLGRPRQPVERPAHQPGQQSEETHTIN